MLKSIKALFLVLMFLLAAGAGVDESTSEDAKWAPVGRWATGGTLFEVSRRDESLRARVIALKHPLYREKDGIGVIGTPKLDHNNPDADLQRQPLLGLELFSDFEFRRGRWEGKFYSPESGRTFNTRLWVENGDLHVRGFILGMPWLGRSRSFSPISACNEDIVRMIAVAGLKESSCH